MHLNSFFGQFRQRWLLYVTLTFLVLSAALNVLSLVGPGQVEKFQSDSESYVIRSIDDNRVSDPVFAPMLKEGGGYYYSSMGLQGIVLRAIKRSLNAEPDAFRAIARLVVGGLTGCCFAAFIAFVPIRGVSDTARAIGAALVSLSPWLSLVAGNLYWCPFLWLLPSLACIWAVQLAPTKRWRGWIVVALTVTIKCLTGYEYLTAIAGAVIAVGVLALDGVTTRRRILERIAVCFGCVVAGFALAVLIQLVQLGILPGGLGVFMDRIHENLVGGRDMHAVVAELKAKIAAHLPGRLKRVPIPDPVMSLLIFCRYFFMPAFTLPGAFLSGSVQNTLFPQLPLIVPVAWVLARTLRLPWGLDRWEDRSLFDLAVFVSLAGCVSWHVAAFGHMHRHSHLNSVLFLIGFLPLAAILMGRGVLALGERIGTDGRREVGGAPHQNPLQAPKKTTYRAAPAWQAASTLTLVGSDHCLVNSSPAGGGLSDMVPVFRDGYEERLAVNSFSNTPLLEGEKAEPAPRVAFVRIANAPVSVINPADAMHNIRSWVERGETRYICVADVHSIMRARKDAAHMQALSGADMVTPDGQPLSVVGYLKGERHIRRVCGPDLMLAVIDQTRDVGMRHYLYGGSVTVVAELKQALETRYPGARIVGAFSPPFRPLTEAEDAADVEAIKASGAQVVWVGLGCPKQEQWMLTHRDRLPGMVLIGVGAAFDFHSGAVARAPALMRRAGLEWFHRLLVAPKRLWRRYLIDAPTFVFVAAREVVSSRLQSRYS